MILSVSKITDSGVTTWDSWEETPEDVKIDIELSIIVKEGAE